MRIGTRLQVMRGNAIQSAGGLKKKDLKYNKKGKIVSKKMSDLAKKNFGSNRNMYGGGMKYYKISVYILPISPNYKSIFFKMNENVLSDLQNLEYIFKVSNKRDLSCNVKLIFQDNDMRINLKRQVINGKIVLKDVSDSKRLVIQIMKEGSYTDTYAFKEDLSKGFSFNTSNLLEIETDAVKMYELELSPDNKLRKELKIQKNRDTLSKNLNI